MTLAGDAGVSGREPHYRLIVEAEHPAYQELLRDLGARPYPDKGPVGPLAITGQLEYDGERIAGRRHRESRRDQLHRKGRLAGRAGRGRGSTARISVGEPSAPVLAGLLDLSGLRLEWPALDDAVRRWSDRPLAMYLLDRFDGELALSSKGGLAGPGFEFTAASTTAGSPSITCPWRSGAAVWKARRRWRCGVRSPT